VRLKAEGHDPFLFISCYCYFGRLHLYTHPGKCQGTRQVMSLP
jgi:hypothetical protein